jgi:hypothetical protein
MVVWIWGGNDRLRFYSKPLMFVGSRKTVNSRVARGCHILLVHGLSLFGYLDPVIISYVVSP